MKATPLHKTLYEQPFGANRMEVWCNLIEIYNREYSRELAEKLFSNIDEVLDNIPDLIFGDIAMLINICETFSEVELLWDNNLVKRGFNLID